MFLSNKKGFSLIELSIVLIIIALLIYGILGGKSLVETTKARALLTEVRNYQQAVYAFETLMGRLPGDLNNTGQIGRFSGNFYSDGDFLAPYDGSNDEYGIPQELSAPFVDLYLQKIIAFEPKHTNSGYTEESFGNAAAEADMVPYSTVLRGVFVYFESAYDFYENLNYGGEVTVESLYFKYNLPAANFVSFRDAYDSYVTCDISPKILKYLDEKLDDGIYNRGTMRSFCEGSNSVGSNSYDQAIDNNGKCGYFINKLD